MHEASCLELCAAGLIRGMGPPSYILGLTSSHAPADLPRKVGEPQSWMSAIEGGSKRRVDVPEFLALAEGIDFNPEGRA
jgi:hypothetical protein